MRDVYFRMRLVKALSELSRILPDVSDTWALGMKASVDDALADIFGDATPIDFEKLSPRTRRALIDTGIVTLEQLATNTDAELLRHPNFGRKSLAEVKEYIASH